MSQDLWETPLPPEEFDRLVARALADLDGTDGEEMAAFMAWFKRRYPTPIARLLYCTAEYRKWTKTRGIARPR